MPDLAATWRRGVSAGVVVVVLVSALSFLVMRPAMSNCNSTIMGHPGDATTGGVWAAYLFKHDGGSPMVGHNDETAYPEGEKFWQPFYVTALTLFGTEWALAHVVSPTCAWNLTVFAGFVLSGLAMFLLVFWLVRSPVVAGIASVAYTFSPYRQQKMQGHLAYVHAEPLLLLLLASFLLWQKLTRLRVVMLAAALALCGYTDGYYILIGGVAFVAFHLTALFYAAFVDRVGRERLVRTAIHVIAAGALASVLMAPVALAMVHEGSAITAATGRTRESLTVYSARPLEYLLPSPSHPYLGRFFSSYQARHLHGSSFSEQNLFLGWIVLLLGGAAIAMALASRRARREALGPERPSLGFAVTVLTAVALAAIVTSGPPDFKLLGTRLHGPSAVIYVFVTSWRVYARLFVLAHAAVVVLAAVGLATLIRGRPVAVQAAASLAVTATVFFEILPFPLPGTWSYGESPEAYYYVAARPEQVLAEYPLVSPAVDPNHPYLTYQPVHRKHMVNVRNADTSADAVARTLAGPADEGTLAVLRAFGVGLVIVHPTMQAPDRPLGPIPPGLELLKSFRFDDPPSNPARLHDPQNRSMYDADVYEVQPGPAARFAMAEEVGFFPSETNGWHSYAWMGTTGQLRVIPTSASVRATTATVSFNAARFGGHQELTVLQGAAELWRGEVTDLTHVAFTAKVGVPIRLVATPGGIPVMRLESESKDNRALAVSVTDLVAEDSEAGR
jgi:hypothetical protein